MRNKNKKHADKPVSFVKLSPTIPVKLSGMVYTGGKSLQDGLKMCGLVE